MLSNHQDAFPVNGTSGGSLFRMVGIILFYLYGSYYHPVKICIYHMLLDEFDNELL